MTNERKLKKFVGSKEAPKYAAMIAGLLVASAWLINLITLMDNDSRGTFGDMFGTVNSIFSGLAFTGVIYAIFLQRQEIEIAREEMARTKDILEEQKNQIKLQNEEAKKQAFENTFFQLLQVFTDLTSRMDISTAPPKVGKDCFPYLLGNLLAYYKAHSKPLYNQYDFHSAYEDFYQKWNNDLGHYFRTIYNIIKFIDKTEMPEKNKIFYSNILRAQLSNAEAALLFHNGISQYGREKFKSLIETYSLLKNVRDRDILHKSLKSEYAVSAFGRPVNQEAEKSEVILEKK
jgi:hypothetical protein